MFKFIATVLALSLFGMQSSAEWAKETDAPYILNSTEQVITVDDNGLSDSTVTREFQAQNEQGRNFLVRQSVPTLPDASTLNFIKGFSETSGVVTAVQAKDTKMVDSVVEQGITNGREMVIPFSNIQIGSKINYTFREKQKKFLVKGLFSRRFTIGLLVPERATKVKIRSLLPLFVKINDPWQAIKSKTYQDGPHHVLEFEQTKPLYKLPIEFNPMLNKDTVTTIDISTTNDWAVIAGTLGEEYEDSMRVGVFPKAYEIILEKAKKQKSVPEKIDAVTSELAKIMTYSGDWTSFEKGYIPRSLDQIAKLKTGDCKDFSIATTAMLRKIGIKANVAFVYRSGWEQFNSSINRASDPIVTLRLFNHAIVKIRDGSKILWVDPTNIVSNSTLTFSDITGSPALELSSQTRALEKIPVPSLEQSRIVFDKSISINADGSADSVTSFEVAGEFVNQVLGISFSRNEDDAKKYLTTLLASDSGKSSSTFDGVDFKTRIAAPMKGKQSVFGELIVSKDKEDKTYLTVPASRSIAIMFALREKRITDANIGSIFYEKSNTHVKGYDIVGYPEGCTVLSPWFKLTRSLYKVEDGFRIKDEMQIMKNEFTAKEVSSDKFQSSLGDIASCLAGRIEIRKLSEDETLAIRLREYTLVKAKEEYDSPGPKSISGSRHAQHIVNQILLSEPESRQALILKAKAVRMVGYKVSTMDRTEYLNESERILDIVLAKSPRDPEAMLQKAWIDYYRKDIPKMVSSFTAAASVSPKDHELYYLSGTIEKKQKNTEKALEAFKKALDLARTDVERSKAAVGVAECLIDKKDIDKGISFYKYAIKKQPENSWVAGNFAGLVQRLGRWDDAIEAGEVAIRVADYGLARKTLADAYGGKGVTHLSREYPSVEARRKSEDLAEATFSKGLQYDATNAKCLKGLIFIYNNRAMDDRQASTATKALSYLNRAQHIKEFNSDFWHDIRRDLELVAAGKKIPSDRAPSSEQKKGSP
ncbi:transglutaminase domain-containing protein [Bdellovibrio sp. HCB290]|uniref:transglutaminase domain-containing protein n=1 Tax=Bdellovibrio sp. HCB290 TaxID=3394356 RepID=UPI0039B64BB7